MVACLYPPQQTWPVPPQGLPLVNPAMGAPYAPGAPVFQGGAGQGFQPLQPPSRQPGPPAFFSLQLQLPFQPFPQQQQQSFVPPFGQYQVPSYPQFQQHQQPEEAAVVSKNKRKKKKAAAVVPPAAPPPNSSMSFVDSAAALFAPAPQQQQPVPVQPFLGDGVVSTPMQSAEVAQALPPGSDQG
jgi:hypothetical protein